MKHVTGGLLTLALWAGILVARLLIGLGWVDTSAGIVVVLQSAWPLAGAVLAVLTGGVAAVTRRWHVASRSPRPPSSSLGRSAIWCCGQSTRGRRSFRELRAGGPASPSCRPGAKDSRPVAPSC